MIDFHQHLNLLSQRSKTKTCWKIRYHSDYLRMSSGKESWTKKSAAKAALFLEFESYLQAHAYGFSEIKEFFSTPYSERPITCIATINARLKTAQEELLKSVEFVEMK